MSLQMIGDNGSAKFKTCLEVRISLENQDNYVCFPP